MFPIELGQNNNLKKDFARHNPNSKQQINAWIRSRKWLMLVINMNDNKCVCTLFYLFVVDENHILPH